MPIKLTKNGVDFSFSGSETLSKREEKKIKHATKKPFSSILLQQQKVWSVKFLDYINITNFLVSIQYGNTSLKKISTFLYFF